MKNIAIKVARVLSIISAPELTCAGMMIHLSLFVWHSWILGIALAVYAALAIYIVHWLKKPHGEIANPVLSHVYKQHRALTFYLAGGFIAIPFVYSLVTDRSSIVFIGVSLVTTIVLLLTTILQQRKISAHVSYTGLLGLYLFPSWLGLGMTILAMSVVGYARWLLHKHTSRQILAAGIIICVGFISALLLQRYVL